MEAIAQKRVNAMMQQLNLVPTAASASPVSLAGIQQGVALIIINNPPVNSFAPAVQQGIEAVYDEVIKNKEVKAIVITGAGKTFMAGADIPHLLSLVQKPINRDELTKFLQSAHALMAKLEEGPVPVVAAINGDAFGGGCELAMACNARVAVAKAKFGLPELKLGVIPGMGGTQRLPRLVGVKDGIETIVSSKNIAAPKALKMGLADVVVKKPEELIPAAVKYALAIASGKIPRKIASKLTDKLPVELELEVVSGAAKLQVGKKSPNLRHPHYAIDAVVAGLSNGSEAGIQAEIDAFITSLSEPAARALLHFFIASKATSKVKGINIADAKKVKSVAILGGGTMGAGIAICFLMKNIPVILKEVNQTYLEAGVTRILNDITTVVTARKMNPMVIEYMMRGLTPQLTYDNFDKCDLVIEAVIEDIPLKQKIFAELESVCNPTCILASNTSTINIDRITEKLNCKDRVVGLHFFSPAHLMPLLEIIRTSSTSPVVLATSLAIAKTISKTPVVVGNCVGFVANRIFFPYGMSGAVLVQGGLDPYAVDKALMKFGMPMGIFRMNDSVGVDLGVHIGPIFTAGYPSRVYNTNLSHAMVAKGRLGQKSGKGFYAYPQPRKAVPDAAGIQDVLVALRKENPNVPDTTKLTPKEIVEICLYPVVNEAARTLAEKYAASAADIDVVSVMGYGFPAYRGGILQWAKEEGFKRIVDRLNYYAGHFGNKTPALKGFFEPSDALKALAK